MCGFLAEFTFNNYKLSSSSSFEALLVLSKHRGPDATHLHSGSHYRLGFNRLAILDLSEKGNQPKYSPSKRYHIVFNGEIYNYKALEIEYSLDNLQSTSDTEVLVHLLDKLGVDKTIKSLNGMFAMSIVDTLTKDLYLIRDFAGIKPLFYGISDKGVIAASQFNQVFNHVWFKEDLKLRPDVMKEYFGFGYMQAPNTIYENIYQVNPGCYLKISSEGRVENYTFKAFPKNMESSLIENDTSTVNIVKESLQKSVNRQLVSDVPLASFLSGGVDSPLISALAKQTKPNIEAFTIGVNHEELDESEQAKAYAKYLNLKHHVHQISEKDLLSSLDAHFENMPEPFGDYSSIPTYLITKLASEHHTVMLSGDSADELFWGYPRMLDIYKKRLWFVVPFMLRKPLVRLLIKLKLTRSWAPYQYKTIQDWVKAKHMQIFKWKLDIFFPEICFTKDFEDLYDFADTKSPSKLLKALRFNEFYGHMQRVLIKVDRTSMANSLEVRVPFLDKDVIDLAWDIEPQFFKSHGKLKYLLKRVLNMFVPNKLIQEKKMGFTVPIEKWLKVELKNDVKKVIFDYPFYGAEFINVDALKTYVDDFYKEKHQASWGIWHIYAWQKWAISQELI